MQNWQKNRNYRKQKNPDGTITHIITIDGADIEVDANLYQEYARYDRAERYQAEREAGLLLSLERMEEDGVPYLMLAGRHAESAEDAAVRKILMSEVLSALSQMLPEEQRLIEAVVMNGTTEQAYANRIGITQKGVNKRKQKILREIHKLVVLKTPIFREG